MKILNVGCGFNVISSCVNVDSIACIKLIRFPKIAKLLHICGVLSEDAYNFICKNQINREVICFSNATKLDFDDDIFDVVYSSHMIEHLTQNEALAFIDEAKRVLKNEGMIRILVPDLRYYINRYNTDGDADAFMRDTYLGVYKKEKTSFKSTIKRFMFGDISIRHMYMYDEKSIKSLLCNKGFENVTILNPGETKITGLPDDVDLCYRNTDSLYIEAKVKKY